MQIQFMLLALSLSVQPDEISPDSVVAVGQGPADVAATDLDADGHADLIVANADGGSLSLLRGDGGGRFRAFPGGEVPAGHAPDSLAIGDFNGDGNMDVVVANHDTTHLSLLNGNGLGRLTAAANSPLSIDVDPHPHVVLAVDLDRDQRLDLLVDDRNRQGVLVLRGLGNGTFDRAGVRVPVGGDPYLGLAVGDLNGDRRDDIVTPNGDEVGVVLALEMTQGTLRFSPPAPIPVNSPDAVGIGDFDGDGHADLVVAWQPALAGLYLGDGQGNFRSHPQGPWPTGGGQAKKLAVGDLDDDGIADAVVLGWDTPRATVIRGGRQRIRIETLLTGRNPWGLVVADLNGDGRDDVAIASEAERSVGIYLSRE